MTQLFRITRNLDGPNSGLFRKQVFGRGLAFQMGPGWAGGAQQPAVGTSRLKKGLKSHSEREKNFELSNESPMLHCTSLQSRPLAKLSTADAQLMPQKSTAYWG
jgi:hypothetical protein